MRSALKDFYIYIENYSGNKLVKYQLKPGKKIAHFECGSWSRTLYYWGVNDQGNEYFYFDNNRGESSVVEWDREDSGPLKLKALKDDLEGAAIHSFELCIETHLLALPVVGKSEDHIDKFYNELKDNFTITSFI